MIEEMSREEIEMEILKNDELYEILDEEKFLNKTYTDEELKNIVYEWILEGDECKHL